jgi:hypothetical protein
MINSNRDVKDFSVALHVVLKLTQYFLKVVPARSILNMYRRRILQWDCIKYFKSAHFYLLRIHEFKNMYFERVVKYAMIKGQLCNSASLDSIKELHIFIFVGNGSNIWLIFFEVCSLICLIYCILINFLTII